MDLARQIRRLQSVIDRGAVRAGVRWTLVFRVASVAINFGAMLVLVRILTPSDYGQAAAVSGLLALLNAFQVQGFMRQALQVPRDSEPDWSLHFRAGVYIQLAVLAACNVIAGLFWLSPSLRPIAPLLHVASIGILIDLPNQLGWLMYNRALEFKALYVINLVGLIFRQGVTIGLALAGFGPYSIVLGSIVLALPFAFCLFALRQWRLPPRWWQAPHWQSYRPAMKYGAEQIGSGVLQSGQAALAAIILPGAYTFSQMGLWARAQALYGTTTGQLQTVATELGLPILPAMSADAQRYATAATRFARTVLLVLIPSGVLLAIEAVPISRLLYGPKWVDADPLLLPAIIAGVAGGIFQLPYVTLVAKARLRLALQLSATWAALTLGSLGLPLMGLDMLTYVWALAATQLVVATGAFLYVGRHLRQDWLGAMFAPIACAVGGAVTVSLVDHSLHVSGSVWQLGLDLTAYCVGAGFVLRAAFPSELRSALAFVPGGQSMARLLALHAENGASQ